MRAVACNEPLRIPVTSQQDIGQGNASYRPVRSAIEWVQPLVMSRDILPRGNVPRQKPAQVDPCSIDVCDQLPIIAAMPENMLVAVDNSWFSGGRFLVGGGFAWRNFLARGLNGIFFHKKKLNLDCYPSDSFANGLPRARGVEVTPVVWRFWVEC